MKRTDREREHRAEFSRMTGIVQAFRGILRQLRPHVITRDADRQREDLSASNAAFAHMLRSQVERDRVTKDILNQILTKRRPAAGVALFQLRAVDTHVAAWRSWVHDTKRDIAVDFPLVGVTPDGMIAYEDFKLRLDQALAPKSGAELFVIAQAGWQRHDVKGRAEHEIIQARIDAGAIATSGDDLSHAKQLREYMEALGELRVPMDLPDYESLAQEASRLRERANLLQIGPINPEHDPSAAAVFRDLEGELLDAGRASDRDDLAAVHEELGGPAEAAAR